MIIRTIFYLLILSVSFVNFALAGWHGSFCSRDNLGWHFYCDDQEMEQFEADLKTSPISKPTGVEVIAQQRQELESAFQEALVYPTEKNILHYISLQKKYAIDQSSKFAENYTLTMWKNPQFDQSVIAPVNTVGKKTWVSQKQARKKEIFTNFNQKYGLFFVFSSTCPYCHAYAPILKRFSQRNNIKIKAITIDNGTLPGFEDAERDNGHLASIGLKTDIVPATFLFHKESQQLIALGAGALSESEIMERIYKVVQFNENQAYDNL